MLKSLTLLGQSDQEIKFKAPALHFTQSAPLGNRRMGVLWSLENPNRTDAASHLKACSSCCRKVKTRKHRPVSRNILTVQVRAQAMAREWSVL
ncbi:hypothetical protein ABIE26_000910 [Pedobacter africanus]|uniref:Uncharacterized protein n=1 Tax=Pedobacter africanus TaxID=151894 RepID=A0ACC6KTY1_9SPHI|nr:hypothetical protein [Pedobacter africanus]MDR6782602.1 hypothetical protein [Pedobacter africanus]